MEPPRRSTVVGRSESKSVSVVRKSAPTHRRYKIRFGQNVVALTAMSNVQCGGPRRTIWRLSISARYAGQLGPWAADRRGRGDKSGAVIVFKEIRCIRHGINQARSGAVIVRRSAQIGAQSTSADVFFRNEQILRVSERSAEPVEGPRRRLVSKTSAPPLGSTFSSTRNIAWSSKHGLHVYLRDPHVERGTVEKGVAPATTPLAGLLLTSICTIASKGWRSTIARKHSEEDSTKPCCLPWLTPRQSHTQPLSLTLESDAHRISPRPSASAKDMGKLSVRSPLSSLPPTVRAS